jgi:DNA polymerase-4/protein ImuB
VAAVRLTGHLEGGGSWTAEQVLREPSARRETLAFILRSRIALSPPTRAVERLVLELTRFGPASSQDDLFSRNEESGREARSRDFSDGEVPVSLRDAVKELKLRLGYSPLYLVVEVDPWSRIPERRHALLSFDP